MYNNYYNIIAMVGVVTYNLSLDSSHRQWSGFIQKNFVAEKNVGGEDKLAFGITMPNQSDP